MIAGHLCMLLIWQRFLDISDLVTLLFVFLLLANFFPTNQIPKDSIDNCVLPENHIIIAKYLARKNKNKNNNNKLLTKTKQRTCKQKQRLKEVKN